MKNLILVAFLFLSLSVFGQPMKVVQSQINVDKSWGVVRDALTPIQEYLNQQISESKINNQTERANKLINLKRGFYSSLREFRNLSIDTTVVAIEVDSLETITKIQKNTTDIENLKKIKAGCFDCDTITINNKIFELKNEKNKLVEYTKKWSKVIHLHFPL